MKKAKTKRAYDNTLREAQARETRDRILSAAVEHLAREPAAQFSIAELAGAAGVSQPTVYRYFPSRDLLFDGIAERLEQSGAFHPLPASLEELPAYVRGLHRAFAENASVVRAALVPGMLREVHERARRRRAERARALYAHELDHLPPSEQRAVRVLVRLLLSGYTWDLFTSREGLRAGESADVLSWTLETLLERIRRDRAAKRRRLGHPGGPSED